MAQKRSKKAGPAKPAAATPVETQETARYHPNRPPPQGQGAAQRGLLMGAVPGCEKLGIALQVLHDPVARRSFTQVYSGQARSWRQ